MSSPLKASLTILQFQGLSCHQRGINLFRLFFVWQILFACLVAGALGEGNYARPGHNQYGYGGARYRAPGSYADSVYVSFLRLLIVLSSTACTEM